MTTRQVWTLALLLLLAPVARAGDGGADASDGGDRAGFGIDKDMYAGLGPALTLASANGKNGGPYTSQMVLPSLELGTYARGVFFNSDMSTWPLALLPFFAPSPDNDYSWMVPPAREDPSVHFVRLSLLNMRFGFALGELGPVAVGLALDGDARAVVYGVYAGGFDTTTTKMGGAEWTQGLGLHAMWDVVDHVRLDVAAIPFFGFDPRIDEFVTSRGVRAYADLAWAVWPNVVALRASARYEHLEWTTPPVAGVFQITTARIGADVFFDVTD